MGAGACVGSEGGRAGVDGIAAEFAAEEVGDEGCGRDGGEWAVVGAEVLGEGGGRVKEKWARARAEEAGYGEVGWRVDGRREDDGIVGVFSRKWWGFFPYAFLCILLHSNAFSTFSLHSIRLHS